MLDRVPSRKGNMLGEDIESLYSCDFIQLNKLV